MARRLAKDPGQAGDTRSPPTLRVGGRNVYVHRTTHSCLPLDERVLSNAWFKPGHPLTESEVQTLNRASLCKSASAAHARALLCKAASTVKNLLYIARIG